MNRRVALQRTALALGFTISTSTAGMLLKSCTSREEKNIPTNILSPIQAKLVDELNECILPTTDTPGAKTLQVVKFVDLMLEEVFSEEKRTSFLKELNAFAQVAQSNLGSPFYESTFESQNTFLQTWVNEHVAVDQDSSQRTFFQTLKEVAMLGYYASEQIGENILPYNPIPGNYDGCVDLEEG
ncbi:gluconate 2-dehydrogenase subunit 3 family protein [Fulvivirga sp. M361]|uniref:gluconate 2-dehydrogenase subunit 3 family protein n=1 Tax=Fulvivirga sp. M361 TaxID=2594266 RepID=UPI00117A7FE0|nr:gluconate 2-dehydrogenase subunit 3 family protein [Fulvivirga sp. M361]TRX46392.1 gluconate 2-dehydrogenase subunit 3 family protein [Fulvivirga sp. M361]